MNDIDPQRAAEPTPLVGHVVTVRGNDLPQMAVEAVEGDEVECVWMNGGVACRNRFRREVLYNLTLEHRRWVEAEAQMRDELQAARKSETAKAPQKTIDPWWRQWPFKIA